MMVRDGVGRTTFAEKGLFDDNIACFDCEQLFGLADQYAVLFLRRARLLIGQYSFKSGIRDASRFPAFEADAALLHQFAFNTLYRAYLSERWECRGIADSEIEEIVRPTLFEGARSIDTMRSVAFVVTIGPLGGLSASPEFRAVPDTPVFILQMPHLTIYVAASDQGLGPGFDGVTLKDGAPVTIYRRRHPERFELDVAGEALKATYESVQRMVASIKPPRRKN